MVDLELDDEPFFILEVVLVGDSINVRSSSNWKEVITLGFTLPLVARNDGVGVLMLGGTLTRSIYASVY